MRNFTLICSLIVFILISVFIQVHPVLDKSSRYRQLANGWVSYYADLYLNNKDTITSKIRQAVNEDASQHGRFRPAFFMFTSFTYALSPIIHGRFPGKENRRYNELINGDMLIMVKALIVCIVLSMVMMSWIIYRYTGYLFLSCLFFGFIPLSPTLSSNLIQNYIDSQEIFQVFTITIFLLFFLKFIRKYQYSMTLHDLFVISVSLSLPFYVKETSVVLFAALLPVFLFYLIYKALLPAQKSYRFLQFFIIFLISLLNTVFILYIVKSSQHGYSSLYSFEDFQRLVNALTEWYKLFSGFPLFNIFSHCIIGIAFIILWRKRWGYINEVSTEKHIIFFLFMIFLTLGFFLIFIPWDFISYKYLYPCTFFYSVLIAYSFSIAFAYCKERNVRSLGIISTFFLIAQAVIYLYNFEEARITNKDIIATANYGLKAVDKVAEDIDCFLINSSKSTISIYLEVKPENEQQIYWAKLQLKRILNLDYFYNIIDSKGTIIFNRKMPDEELSSFRYIPSRPTVYISHKFSDLDKFHFDLIYRQKSSPSKDDPVSFNLTCL